jgi:acetyl-CoA synthetase
MSSDHAQASTPDLGAHQLQACGVPSDEAASMLRTVRACMQQPGPREAWRSVCEQVLRPDQPFALHQLLFDTVYAGWEASRGPAPVWVPTDEDIGASNVGPLMNDDFAAYHRFSVEEPERYWSQMLARLRIHAAAAPQRIVERDGGPEHARWLVGMRLNIARSCFDGRDRGRPAVVFQKEGGELQRRSLGQLENEAAYIACALAAAGYGPGDAIAIDMPMGYEAVAIYLGVVMLGAAVVSIADSFAPAEIATRLRIAEARAIFTQDVIVRGGKELPLYQRVCDADAPQAIVLPARDELAVTLREGDLDWFGFLACAEAAKRRERYTVREVEDVTNILFSSGTTGDPKAIAWTHATPIKAASDAWGHHDVRPGDVVAWPTNLGWMMGPWLIYASLLNDATIALFEGSPVGRSFGEFVQQAGVTMLGVVPSLVKSWRSSECMSGLDWSAIRCFSSTGEASNPSDMHWLMSRAGYKPVVEYCGGTEIGGGYICGSVVQPQAASAFSTAALGCDFVILDEQGDTCDNGELALVPPMLGSSNRLLNRDHHEVYFAGMPRGPRGQILRRHGDQVERLGGGYYRAQGRVDDTMNLGGIKTSSADIERVCNRLEGVRECAAIAATPAGGGPSELVLFVVAEAGTTVATDQLRPAAQRRIAAELNPLFKVRDVVLIDELPRTASNKVMRRVLRRDYAPGR